MNPLLPGLLTVVLTLSATASSAADSAPAPTADAIKASEGVLTIPTYQSPGRDINPPLFSNSNLIGLYPFTTYRMPYKPGGPVPEKYPAVFIENEYLKLTYIPELGGRFFRLYDKLHHEDVFYYNDVIKPADYTRRYDFPLTGIELTGPYDDHSRTLHGEPYWSHTIVRHKDGSVSVLLAQTDPIYHMEVTFTATLYPGVAAMETSVFCYNPNDVQKPQMFWTSASMHSTPKTRFLYPMTRTVGHTTGEVASWPEYNGVDYSWDRNNHNMLGVFGIDTFDNYGGAYKFDLNYGLFRYADRRVVQGMKMWTFGYGPLATAIENAYTDHAGPYIEIQSGRMLWDGYYEYVDPHKVETWHEWWIPVAGINGLTTLAKDVALNLTVTPDGSNSNSSITVALSPVRTIHNAKLVVTTGGAELLKTSIDLVPGTPVKKTVTAKTDSLRDLQVRISAADGKLLMDYVRPDNNPGGKDNPYANGLSSPPVPLEKMTAEEAVMAAQLKQKEFDYPAATELVNVALKRDPGFSPAHQLLGQLVFNQNQFEKAATEFQKAVDRNPYDSDSWYYLSICQLRLNQQQQAERNLYHIWPGSSYYGPREYQLGQIAYLRHDNTAAEQYLLGAINSNGTDLKARLLLAVLYRDEGRKDAALEQLAKVNAADPADRIARAEKFFLTGNITAENDLRRLMGGQGEDAIEVSIFYSSLSRWKDTTAVLKMVLPPYNKDPWGISPVYYYTLAYAQKQAGDLSGATESRKKARAAKDVVERFSYRSQTRAPLEDAVKNNPNDTVARFNLACLLYFRGHPQQAVEQWQQIVQRDPTDFGSRRALGLAYEAQGNVKDAIPQMQAALKVKPDNLDTLDNLGAMYAREGRFDEEIALLRSAFQRDPANDHLAEGLMNADLMEGRYKDAEAIVEQHTFAPRHRTYTVREEYRELEYGMGAAAFNRGNYEEALKYFQAALKPPVSLGVDNFEHQSTPRIHYYIGRTLDAFGRHQDAKQAYQESTYGVDHLVGSSDALSSENFFILLSLDRLGKHQEALDLMKQFKSFADSRKDSPANLIRAKSYYMLGQIDQYNGHPDEAKKMMAEAIQLKPDYIGPRYELRGDAIDPASTMQGDTGTPAKP
jgi:tetratricopeptide (TPR) repeat protein